MLRSNTEILIYITCLHDAVQYGLIIKLVLKQSVPWWCR